MSSFKNSGDIQRKRVDQTAVSDNQSFSKDHFANSSSCTTTELSKLLTSCLTAVKSRVIRYYETVYERSRRICLGLSNILARYLVN